MRKPVKRIKLSTIESDAGKILYKCNTCDYDSPYSKNVTRHIKSNACRSKRKDDELHTCFQCYKTFGRSYHLKRHINTVHTTCVNQNQIPSFCEIPGPSSIVFDDGSQEDGVNDSEGNVIEDNQSLVQSETISVSCDVIVNVNVSDGNYVPDNYAIDNVEIECETDIPGIGNVIDRNGASGNDPTKLVPIQCETRIPVDVSENVNGVHGLENKDPLILEIANLLKNRNKENESTFIENIINMLKDDMSSKIMAEKKQHALNCLNRCFGDMLSDTVFIKWLSNQLGYKPGRLLSLLKTGQEFSWKSRNSLNVETHQEVYDFWKKNSITSVDRRNGRNKIKIPKMKYLSSCFQYISDNNIQEEAHVHKKTKNEKKYMSAQRMVQAETVEKMYANFVKEKSSKISKSTFFKYKPFYVEPATICEKESCLCSTCLNIHCLMQAVNVFRKSSGFEKHFSVTQFLQEDHDVDKTIS